MLKHKLTLKALLPLLESSLAGHNEEELAPLLNNNKDPFANFVIKDNDI